MIVPRAHERCGLRVARPVRRSIVGMVTAIATVGLLFGCTEPLPRRDEATPDTTLEDVRACRKQERPDFIRLEEFAREVLGQYAAEARIIRYGSCRDTLTPRAYLYVEMKDWSQDIQAARYFRRAGLSLENHEAVTDDRLYLVRWGTQRYGAGHPYVKLTIALRRGFHAPSGV